MKISPLQLVHLAFRRVHVAVDVDHMEAAQQDGADAHSMLEGALIKTEVGVTPLEEEDPRGVPYLVTLRVWIDNVHGEDDSERRYSPYLIDIEAGGKIVLRKGSERLGDPEDLIAVNGPALLWSAIRDQVANLTARMPLGYAMLPSVNFFDLKKARPAPPNPMPESASAAPVTKRKRAAKAATPQP
ncbi:MAG: hypothetical protein KDI60_13555 [Xanthomonadales bacterium]|nr:hypothetical protein [Xanthomonadales bacterium]